ncbi:hypothetical protein GY45DRAFT_1361029 [Cubamyces sp. BRFM 1775]|nr:hypothetical protein GY45DRAFT_1361029 [Cubamyces sp. BRFM 1775]
MKAFSASTLALLATLQASIVLAQTSLYIPGFDAQAITADVEGVDAQGRTTWRIGPGAMSGTYEDPAGIIGSATLVADATEAHLVWENTEVSMTLSEDCAIANGLAVCGVVADVDGTIQSMTATETASAFEVQGATGAAPTNIAASPESSDAGSQTGSDTGSSTPTAGSGVSTGPSQTGTSTGASPTNTTTQDNGVGKVQSSLLASVGVVGLFLASPVPSEDAHDHVHPIHMPRGAGDSTQAESAHPRRAAARKASRLAAEQLESSPIPSDAENDGAVTFGEPSTPKGGVRFTYGGKRKYKQSPSKSSPSSHAGPSRTRPRSISVIEQSATKTSEVAKRGRGASRGRGGRKAQNTHKRTASVEASSDHLSEPEGIHADENRKPKPRSRRNTATTAKEANTVEAKRATDGISAGQASKKRPLSLSSSDGEGSILTPLSSPDVRRSPTMRTMPVLAPRLARQFMRSQSQAETSLTQSRAKALLKHTKSLDQILALDSTDDESFDELDVGSFAWVSIDLKGELADVDGSEDNDTLWWPAKVDLPRPCMRVSLFGHPPGVTDSGCRQLDIPSPSPSNVRSMVHNGRIRFTETDYRPCRALSMQSSPRKRRKLELDDAWQEARDLMLKADEAQNQGQTFVLSAAKAGPSSTAGKRKANPFPTLENQPAKGRSKGKGRAKGKGRGSDVSLSDLDEDLSDFGGAWEAPEADLLLEIPGELVLARDARAHRDYWPAKLLEYVKPQNPRQRPKYKVLFFDGTVKAIEPDLFWTTTDPEFATCQLGEARDNYGLDSDIDDADDETGREEEFNRPFAPEDDATLRAPSPLSSLPPPDPLEFEYDMSIAEQFEYVKPVLAAVLEGQYAPALQRHEGFMRGAGARQKVLDAVPLRGSLSAREKEEVAFLVRSWARRRERRREMGVSTEYVLEPVVASEGGDTAEANGEVHDNDDDDADSVLTPTSEISGGDTESLAPFEAEPPPSSFAANEGDTDDDERARDAMSDAQARVEHQSATLDDSPAGREAEDAIGPSVRILVVATSVIPLSDRQDASRQDGAMATAALDTAVTGDETASEGSSRAPPRTTFHDLDPVEKITYCNNVLLQEAILQLLLWRTGQRKALGLLSPEEEQRLHDIALEEGEKTDWVHDVIRMRQASEGTMLPASKGKEKASEAVPGVRARTRRGGL